MRWPKTMAMVVYSWLPRLLPCVGTCFNLVGTSKMLSMQTMWDVWSRTLRGSSVWCVDQVFSYMVYIDLNLHDSRIWVPLVCGSHHIVNLMKIPMREVTFGHWVGQLIVVENGEGLCKLMGEWNRVRKAELQKGQRPTLKGVARCAW
jgi:hypothetical protein